MAKNKYENYTNEQLIEKIKKLEKHRYGLVWEGKEEAIAEQCEQELPVLVEDKEREIKQGKPDDPTHFIFEGDNYHTLYTLNFTHKKKIDVIYIDPPYNTGKTDNKGQTDFRYNDRFIDKNDRYRHSKWLSFINKRLRLAKFLLKDTGVIAISIDDNELANLKLLCDKIFGENNHIATVPTIMNLKGNQDQFGFAGAHEYTLFYCKNKSLTVIGEFDIDEDEINDDWLKDEKGYYKKGRTLLADGQDKYREDRPNSFYPMLVKDGKISLITKEEFNKIYNKNSKSFDDKYIEQLRVNYEKKGFLFVLPLDSKSNLLRWTWSYSGKIQNSLDEIIVVQNKNKATFYKKQRPSLDDLPSKKPKSFFYKPEYSSGNGTNQLKKFKLKGTFNNPKPIDLIKDILFILGNKNAKILDFFAGSATTGQAVLELNNLDGGTRQFILCTNNENKICEDVAYPRIQQIIEGYADKNPIPANIKYFKTDFVPNVLTDNDKRTLVAKSTELLCIAENTFDVVIENKRKLDFAIFKNNTQQTAIIYDEDYIADCCKELNKINSGLKTVIYVFSYDHTYDKEDFDGLKVEYRVKPIPEAILNVYRKISKLKRK